MLPPGMKSNCEVCQLRPVKDGGSGQCRFSASVRRAYAPTGPHDDCPNFDPREYVPPRERLEMKLHPQEAALF